MKRASKPVAGCQCASCRYTNGRDFFPDSDATGADIPGSAFAKWPKGKPAGRKSAADYSAHVSFGQGWGADAGGRISAGREVPAFTVGGPAVYAPWCHAKGTMPQPDGALRRWLARTAAGPVFIDLEGVAPNSPAPVQVAQEPRQKIARKPRAERLQAPADTGTPNILSLLELAIATHAARQSNFPQPEEVTA